MYQDRREARESWADTLFWGLTAAIVFLILGAAAVLGLYILHF